MRINIIGHTALALSVALVGCVSTPKDNATLAEARSSYEMAQQDPAVVKYAPVELKAAGDALGAASGALQKHEKQPQVDHLAYLAKQKVAIAQETARLKTAEEQMKTAGADRDKVLLQARTVEADRLRTETDRLRNELNAKPTDRGMTITLGDVLFDTGKAHLKSGSQRSLQKLAQFLAENPQRRVAVEGFTDSVGGDDYNQNLSEQRANAVRDAIIGLGVASDRVSARGYGKAFPIAGNEAAAGRQLNRRVEIIVGNDDKDIAPR